MSIFIKPLEQVFPQIVEIDEIVGQYEVYIDSLDKPLKIKVKKIRDSYLGIANLEVRGKGCATHYRSMHTRRNKEEAVEEAVRGFFAFYSDEADVREVENW